MDWEKLFLFMQQQALVGVGYLGIGRLKREGIDIPKRVFLKWYTLSEKIKARNGLVNQCCVGVGEMMKKDGFSSCILKGQGNSLLYPNPYVRLSGDIDIFVMKAEGMGISERRRIVMDYVRQRFPQAIFRYHHIHYPVFKDVAVEVHFLPTIVNNPVYYRRIQRWAEDRMAQQCSHVVQLPDGVGSVSIPTNDFNLIYQLSHLMHHFFDEGIGLRQMMDYYFVLKNVDGASQDRAALEKELRYLGLYRFAGAVMYVMQEVFGLEAEWMIAPVDAKRGKTLMGEILKGGNFGKYSGLTNHSTGTKYFLKIRRNLRFVREYPAEALSEPVFRTWHFFWRLCHRR